MRLSPDGSKAFRVTSYPPILGIFDGSKVIWETEIDVPLPLNDAYLILTSDSNGFAYHSNGSVLSSGIGSDHNSKELVLKNTGLLYIKDMNDTAIWMNLCPVVASPSLVAKQSLLFADFCMLSPDENSFMELQSGGKLVVYTGYTPQHTFERPDQQGGSLEFNDVVSLSMTGTRYRDEDCYKAERRQVASDRFTVFAHTLKNVVGGNFSLDSSFNEIIRIAEPFRGRQDGRCDLFRKELWNFQKELLLDLDKYLTPSFERNKLSGLVKSLVFDVHQKICSYIGMPITGNYTIFNTPVKNDYTVTVSNDAKISVKNDNGEELWTNYPNLNN
ncbi:MAG: hypothetical protein J3Q66DRAFT_375852 [Benniella sp.]|nr:MAG: hypothetical protein J3Q66DRAFT_375846 [Benniella sp.]KAK3805328.1 MAG: hypothetical protein J3Q66DRAFT_375852 [Benniella sp.]